MAHILNGFQMNNRIGLVMVTFGRKRLLQRSLETLFNTIDPTRCEVTIVDNNSEQDVINLLLSYKDKIDNLVLLNENKGKPYAWNLGSKISRQECLATKLPEPSYLLFCDSDLDFKPGWHDVLVDSYEEHKDLPLCGLSGKLWPPHKVNGIEHKGKKHTIYQYRFPCGCCILMSTKAFDANGYWDTRRKIRTVDTSYFRNAINRKYINASVAETVIDHTGSKQRTWNISNGKPKYIK